MATIKAAPRGTATNPGYEGYGLMLAILLLPLNVAIALIFGDVFLFGQLPLGIYMLILFGLTQFVYILPLAWWLRRRGKTRTAHGLLSTAAVIFLLNSGCCGYLFVAAHLTSR